MSKKKIIAIAVSFSVLVVIFAGLTVAVTLTTTKQQTAELKEEANTTEVSSADAEEQLEAAQTLIGETVTQDDIKEKVGEWNDFEMSSAGCERGVYAGKFYYSTFIINTRTYDKGETYSVVSAN